VKDNKCFYRYISCKSKRRVKVGLLLKMAELATKDTKRPTYFMPSLSRSLLITLFFRNPRPLRPVGRSGVMKTYPW